MDDDLWPGIEQIKDAVTEFSNIVDNKVGTQYECEYNLDEDGEKDELFALNGRFGIAFLMKNRHNDNDELCFRVWLKDVKTIDPRANLSERLKIISETLKSVHLPYFLDFFYMQKALRVGKKELPGIRMKWVDGLLLSEYVKDHASEPMVIEEIAQKFLAMCRDLKLQGIAHGDLSNKNIMVTYGNDLKLIDYDSVHVPRMGKRYYQVTGGADGFQHPYRAAHSNELFTTVNDDNFSQQVIYLSLLAIARNPQLADKIDSDMLFIASDYRNDSTFTNSNGYKDIIAINDERLNMLLAELRRAVTQSYDKVRSIVDIVDEYQAKTIWATYCGHCGHHFNNQTDKFCPDCGEKRQTLS